MTKRSIKNTLIIGGILTFLLERGTSIFINYGIITKPISIFFYYAISILALVDIYYIRQNELKRYHIFELHQDICVLLASITIFHISDNIGNLNVYNVAIYSIILFVLGYVAVICSKKAYEDEELKGYYN